MNERKQRSRAVTPSLSNGSVILVQSLINVVFRARQFPFGAEIRATHLSTFLSPSLSLSTSLSERYASCLQTRRGLYAHFFESAVVNASLYGNTAAQPVRVDLRSLLIHQRPSQCCSGVCRPRFVGHCTLCSTMNVIGYEL